MFGQLGQLGRLGQLGGASSGGRASSGGLSKAAMIAQLTALGAVSFFLPSDYSTAAWRRYDATTEAGMVDYPIGFLGDILQDMALGPELVTNGDFSQGTTGWSAGASATISVTDGVLMITTASGSVGTAYQSSISTDIPAFYVVDGDSINGTGNSQAFISGCNPSIETGFAIIRATSSPIRYNRRNSGQVGTYSYHDNCTMRRVLGNHSIQATDSNRPLLIYSNGVYSLAFSAGQSLNAYVPASAGSTCTVVYASPGAGAVTVSDVPVASNAVSLTWAHSGLVLLPSTATSAQISAAAAIIEPLAWSTV